MPVKYEVVAITGQYTDATGAEKNRYTRMGVVIQTQKGSFMLKLESIPVGWDGSAFLNDPRPREEKGAPAKTAPRKPPAPADDSDVPF